MKKQIATLKRRGLSVFLALALCVSLVQVNAFALEPGENPVPVEPTALTIDLENPDGKQDPAPSEDDPAADPDQSDPAEEPDPAPDPDPAAEEEPGQGEGEEPGDPEPGQGEGTDDPEEETPQEPEEGSVKTDEVLEAGKDQLPKPPDSYEQQEDGSYVKVDTVTSKKTSGLSNKKTETTVDKITTHTYKINEVKDEESGAFLGYETVTTIDTKYVTTTKVTEIKQGKKENIEVSKTPIDGDSEDFPLVKDGNGSSASNWTLKDGATGTVTNVTTHKTTDLQTGKPGALTGLPDKITYLVKTEEKNGDVTVVTVKEITYTVLYSSFAKPTGQYSMTKCTEQKTTTTVSTDEKIDIEPTRTSTKQLLTVEQDADGVITYKAPVANDSSVEGLTPVTPDVDQKFNKNLLNPSTKEPVEVDSDFIFKFLGESALRSAIKLNPYGKVDSDMFSFNAPVSLYILRDEDGKAFYAYCADQEIASVPGTDYSLGNFGDGKTLSAETVSQVQAAALNGYWGTTDGFGSLASIKEMLKQALASEKISGVTEDQIDKLTDGAAMSATQAAIWHLMNNVVNSDDPIHSKSIWNPNGTGNTSIISLAKNAEPAATAFYRYLIETAQMPEDSKPATDIIRADDLKEVKVDVIDVSKEAAVDSAAVYNADVSFILDVDVDRMNSDNLVVTLIDAQTGKQIGESYKLLDARQEGGDGKTYTLANVQLPNGTTITLKLNGTQAVEKNAYLILADTGHEMSQTFVGVMEGDYNVNLSMNVHFSINDITVKPDPTPTPTPRPDPTPDPDPEPDIPDPDVPLVPGPDPEEPPVDIPDPDVPLTPEPPEVDVPDPAVPLAPRPTKPAKPQTSVPTVTEIPDQAVPLADVPNTGDDSALWLSVALAAAAGIVCVKLLEKKKVK